MILRRFMKHVNEQNWFAVGLDVLVVIVGIYLGLQVTEWANEREQRAQELIYLKRLQIEVDQLIKLNELRDQINFFYFDKLATVTEVITTSNQDNQLTQDHCDVLVLSSEYTGQAEATPTMTELITSGQLSLLSDQSLRTAIARYLLSKQTYDDNQEILRMGVNDLTITHPDLVKLVYKNRIDSSVTDIPKLENLNIICDFNAMKENDTFKNVLANNYGRATQYIYNNKYIFERLKLIQERLNEILGIAHERSGE